MISNLNDLLPGQLYTTDGKDAWVLEGYFSGPSLTLKNLVTGEKMNGGLGCPNFEPFSKLIKEEK